MNSPRSINKLLYTSLLISISMLMFKLYTLELSLSIFFLFVRCFLRISNLSLTIVVYILKDQINAPKAVCSILSVKMSGTAFYTSQKGVSSHPFLRYSTIPPNDGEIITNISDLKNKEIHRLPIEIFRGVASSRFRFNISLEESESPVTNTWTLVDIAKKYPPFGWESLFLQSIVELEYKDRQLQVWDYYPEKRYIFRAFEECPFDKVKVVFIGQDPYESLDKKSGLPYATGLAFSSDRRNTIPVVLKNIFTEIKNTVGDVGSFCHPDLSKWVQQGVLLLNASLTVEKENYRSHKNEWKGFIARALKYIQNHHKDCIYILLGNDAQNLTNGSNPVIANNKRVLMAGYPNSGHYSNFFNSGIFAKVNQLLREDGKDPIDWNID